jgi:putative holliday junction resolvase
MSRIMAIDYGDVRIGIALTDPLQIISSGFKTLQNNNNVFTEIINICQIKNVEKIVIGIPFNKDSEIGDSAKKVILFTKILIDILKSQNIDLQFFEQDERYTTTEALFSMREIGVKRKKKKRVIDQIAAANILFDFMQSKVKKQLDIIKYLEKIR